MNERKLLRDIDPVCYGQVNYLRRLYWVQRQRSYRHRSRKRKELFRAYIRLFSFNANGSCSIRDIDDDYRYECCKHWYDNIHKNKPYKYKQ